MLIMRKLEWEKESDSPKVDMTICNIQELQMNKRTPKLKSM